MSGEPPKALLGEIATYLGWAQESVVSALDKSGDV